ncbi:hypothetical protein FBEOM_4283 [Fusarium beomiforme]|uniref:Uncharacterized protein n=1 Tax=Fusarium beomiforme TaxID=44412 RepID=A0A9P5DY91_9HYPO|nr:hypothetical protein FBEOM_4283 [Fusarium beomiforme]
MHLLSGVGGSCASTEKANNVSRRDSSISLEESAYKRDNPEPSRNTLAPLESQHIKDQHEDNPEPGCTLPTPSLASSPSVAAPMDVYLRCGESFEARLMRLGAILDQGRQMSEPENISLSPEASSWEVVNTPQTLGPKAPSTPIIQPSLGPRATDIQPATADPDIEVVDKLSVDSSMSDLLLPDASQTVSDRIEGLKQAANEYRTAAKQFRRNDRTRIRKVVKQRAQSRRKDKSKSV